MTASDRHRIHNRFEELFGPDDAGIVMEYLPPRPWDEIATKDDLRELKHDLIDHIDLRVEAAVGRAMKGFYFAVVAANATMAAAIGGLAVAFS